MKLTFAVEGEPVRADRFLADRLPGRGRHALAEAFAAGRVRVNGRRARKGDRVAAGDVVEVTDPPPDAAGLRPVPEAGPLAVLHQDAHRVVVAKPPGMPSHPLRAGETGTLANALVARYPECATAGADPREAGLVHRLDAGTSGVLAAARDPETWRDLRAAFREGRVEKEYLALVAGEVKAPGAIASPVGGLPAETRYQPVGALPGFTLVRCATATGRRHQVRIHLAERGWPIVGDAQYGGALDRPLPLVGHFLHASRLVLPDLDVCAPLPPDREATLALLAN